MPRLLTIAAVILLTTATAAAAASVRAVVDRNRATVGESIDLQLIIDGGDGEADLSGLTGFRVIDRGTTNSFQMINGRTSRQRIQNYTLIPAAAGDLTVPAIPVTIDGKVHYTAPIRITVSTEPAVDSGRRDVYVTAAVSQATPWIGQQFTYTFRLYNAVQVADAKFQAPAFDGFHAEELEDRKSHRTIVNGREFIVTEVQFILVPVKHGRLTIEPAVLQVGMLQHARRARPFAGMDAFFGRTEMKNRVLQSDPITVTVRDLPASPPGVAYSGLVGRFDISATLEKTDLAAGDSTTLAVTVSGSGNIMDAAPPDIPAPEDFKTYADNPEEQVRKDADGYSGSKTFRTALVPMRPGDYRIDPISLTYFDVERGDYRTLSTAAATLHVTPSDMAATDIDVFKGSSESMPALKKRVEFTGRDILPIKESLAVLNPRRGLSPVWFAVLMVLPMLGFAVTLAVRRATRRDDSPEQVMAARSRQALRTASSADTPDADFLSALYRALVSAILARKGIIGTSLTWSEARSHLADIGWDAPSADAAARLLETIESFNYSGATLDAPARVDLLDHTRQVLRRLAR